MRKKCKTCGAPLEDIRCDYCGTVHGDNRNDPQSATVNSNESHSGFETTNSSPYQNIQNDDNTWFQDQRKLAINSVAGAFDIVNVVTLSAFWLAVINMLITERRGLYVTNMQYGILGLTYLLAFIFVIVVLILHIVGAVKSKKAEIMITGHILGIVASSISIVSLLFLSFFSIILFIIAIPFTFAQKNIDWK